MLGTVDQALEALRNGEVVLVYDADGREEETDMVIASEHVTPEIIQLFRKEAGGLICATLSSEVRRSLGLPFLVEVFQGSSPQFPIMSRLMPNDLPYDTKSAFGITINHRRTFTGITDADRARTIAEFAKLARAALQSEDGWAQEEFGREFRAPGHVHLLNAADGLLDSRFGHTELSTALVMMAGLIPSATICEMMGDDGRARSKAAAQTYAQGRGLIFLEGREVVERWRQFRAL